MDFHVNRETYDSWRRKLISDYEAEKAALLDKNGNQTIKQDYRKPHHEQHGNQHRPQQIEPHPPARQRTEAAPKRQKDARH